MHNSPSNSLMKKCVLFYDCSLQTIHCRERERVVYVAHDVAELTVRWWLTSNGVLLVTTVVWISSERRTKKKWTSIQTMLVHSRMFFSSMLNISFLDNVIIWLLWFHTHGGPRLLPPHTKLLLCLGVRNKFVSCFVLISFLNYTVTVG